MSQEADPHVVLLRRAQRLALAALVVGGTALLLGVVIDPPQAIRSALPAWLFWTGASVGCLGVLMIHHIAGGGWGAVIRRPLEAAAANVVTMGVHSVLMLAGLLVFSDGKGARTPPLYVWADPAARAADPVLAHKALYLNPPFFVGRTVLYFLVWVTLARLFDRWSLEQDRAPSAALTRRIRGLAGPGLLLLGLTVSFAAIDWVMSIEPHWFSSIYGLMFLAGDAVSGLSVAIVTVVLLARTPPMREALSPAHLHDLGNLLLAFVMLWAYMAFSQYLIIWSGNLPEETPWYLRRSHGGWQWLAGVILVLHFAIPFTVLLSRTAKRRASVLASVAASVIVMRHVDLHWLVAPAFRHELSFHWLDVAAPLAVGGAWVFLFARRLAARPVLPLHDHRVEGPALAAEEALS